MKTDHEQTLLANMGLDFEMLNSGCCGMAGSFGFEAEKYDVSVAVGERVLLPSVREADDDTLIIADGFSCREQVADLSSRGALHMAQVMQMALHEGPSGPPRVHEPAESGFEPLGRWEPETVSAGSVAFATGLGLLAGAGLAWGLTRALRGRS